MKRSLLLPMLFLALGACSGGGGKLTDPPPSPGLSPEEARRLSEERSRAERESERGRLTPEELDNLPGTGPAPMVATTEPVTTTRPLTEDEQRTIREALASCSTTAATVNVQAEPGGVVFLAPGQRFPEADLRCYAEKLGAVRLARDVARRGTITLP